MDSPFRTEFTPKYKRINPYSRSKTAMGTRYFQFRVFQAIIYHRLIYISKASMSGVESIVIAVVHAGGCVWLSVSPGPVTIIPHLISYQRHALSHLYNHMYQPHTLYTRYDGNSSNKEKRFPFIIIHVRNEIRAEPASSYTLRGDVFARLISEWI